MYQKWYFHMTRVILYDQKSIHIDGYKSIISFGEDTVCLQCKKRVLEISGKNLFIESFNGIEMTICGNIAGVKWNSM